MRKVVMIHDGLVKFLEERGLKLSLTVNRALSHYLEEVFGFTMSEEEFLTKKEIVMPPKSYKKLLPEEPASLEEV